MSDLWTEASVDIDAEHAALRLTRAKVAVAGLWPFLAQARGPREFEHRLALTAERITERVDVDLLDAVVASLREDFLTVTAKDEDDEPEDDGESDDGKPKWLQDKIKGEGSLAVTAYYDWGLQRWVKLAVEDDQTAGKGNPAYFVGGPEGGPNTGQTNQYPPHPTGQDPWSPINDMFPMQPTPWSGGVEWQESPMNFTPPGGGYHPNSGQRAASRLPFVAVEHGATDTCADCRLPVKAVPVSWGSGTDWTHTGEHGFEADDHHTPVPARYMRTAYLRSLAGEGIVPTPGPNPNYFAGGEEGVQGDDAFPEAPSEDPTDDRVDWYGSVPPMPSGGSGRTATVENPGPDSDKLLGTEFASPQERSRWDKLQDPEAQAGSRDSSVVGRRHAFFDPYDPGVRMVAVGEDGTQPGTPPQGASAAGGVQGEAPEPPPSMTPGGPGAMAATPMTTPPRQIPGGGAAGMPMDPMAMAARLLRIADGQSRDLASDDDPTGLGDEYREKTIEGPLRSRPRQPAEHRNVNTPQRSQQAIPTTSSPDPQENEEEGRREAARAARWAVELVGAR